MNFNDFGMFNEIVKVKAYSDIVSTATNTTHVKVTGHKVMFLIDFTTITGDSVAVTVEASTAGATTGAEAIGFYYRLSHVAASGNTWGAVTSADSTGVDVTATDDNKMLMVMVDAMDMNDDDRYLSVLLSPGASASAVGVSAICMQDSRYRQYDHISST